MSGKLMQHADDNASYYMEGVAEGEVDEFKYLRYPLLLACLAVVAFAATSFPDTVKMRPFPVFWRCLLGIQLCYSFFMTFVLLIPKDRARSLFKLFHPIFGQPLKERSYADDCRVYTPENDVSKFFNIYDAVFDVHFVAHLGGWWFKMHIIRDWYAAWIISGTFELVEISLRHWLNNFWECWWDHLFLDLFGCNMFGIIVGGYTMSYFNV